MEISLGPNSLGGIARTSCFRIARAQVWPLSRGRRGSRRVAGDHRLVGHVDRHFAPQWSRGCHLAASERRSVVNAARRVLLFGGMALAIWGMAYGLWYAVFAEHQALNAIGASLAGAFTRAGQGNPAVRDPSLQHYHQPKYVYDRREAHRPHRIRVPTPPT